MAGGQGSAAFCSPNCSPDVANIATVARRGTPLTVAERRALEVMKAADTEADAAHILGVSRGTVHAHLANARSRLDVRTTRQAITKAGI